MKFKISYLLLALMCLVPLLLYSQNDPYTVISRGELDDLDERNLDGAFIFVKLYEDQFVDATLNSANFILATSIPGLTVGEVFYRGVDTCICRLSYPPGSDFDVMQYIALTIDASELAGPADASSINTLPVYPLIEPVITNITFPDRPYGIGDIVYCTITVESNSEPDYTYVEGTVADRTLLGFRQTGTTTYEAYFEIEEGGTSYTAEEDIPVVDVRLFNPNGFVYGEFYNALIVQPNDLIDCERPVVHSAWVNGGTYRVGQVLPVVITADQAGYIFDPDRTTINGIPFSSPRITLGFVSGNQYYLNYSIAEGDHDVFGTLPLEIVMADQVGNINLIPFTAVSGEDPVIDANSPDILSAEITDPGVAIIGDTVEILLTLSEENVSARTGTHVNQVPLGPRVKFEHVSGTGYRLIYVVYEGDQNVSAGNLAYNLVMRDAAGNESSSGLNPSNNIVSVFATRPTGIISGGGDICMGDSLRIFASFTGFGPWDFIISGTQGFNRSFKGISGSFGLYVSPPASETFYITDLYDVHGNTGTGYGEAEVTVNPVTPVSILNTEIIYTRDLEDPVQLLGDPPGGIFSGTGVESSTGLFYPNLVGPSGISTITYTYINQYGCLSTASKQFFVIDSSHEIEGLNDVICGDETPVTISATNESGEPGTFRLFANDSTEVTSEGLFDQFPDDDRVIILPDQLPDGLYWLEYTYVFNEQIFRPRTPFYLNKIESFTIESPDRVCSNESLKELRAAPNSNSPNIEKHIFEGPSVEILSTGFFFNPQKAETGDNPIRYEVTSVYGCVKDTTFNIEKLFVPVPGFDVSRLCISSGGGEVAMINLTEEADLVKEWFWQFGDVNSGANNTSTLYEPVHNFTAPGNRTIQLRLETFDGCVANTQKTYDFSEKPVADFRWVSDCFVPGKGVVFVNESYSVYPWTGHTWMISDKSGNLINKITMAAPDNMVYQFSKQDDYLITLICENNKSCVDSLERLMVLKPTLDVNPDKSYFETFNESNGRWDKRADSQSISSWSYGQPDFTGFNPTQGDYAWFTDLPANKTAESSWVQSPCFDLGDLERPQIRLDIMKSFDARRDGAVLQYTLDNGDSWHTVGNLHDGVEWYNASNIINPPGGSRTGWSGTGSFNPDSGWLNSAHDLNDLIGAKNVIFRIAYATDGGSVENNQGFAFDNIFIGERTRKTVLEHFTNSSSSKAMEADDIVDEFITGPDSLDVIALQYHMSYPGYDPMNQNNPFPASGRSFYYGITGVPFAVMDGGVTQNFQYDFNSTIPRSIDARLISLEMPQFNIGILAVVYSGEMEIMVNLTSRADYGNRELLLHTVIAEGSVTAYTGENGDTEFRNVVLEMLPDPAGKLIEKGWFKGESVTEIFHWTMENYQDPEELMVVGFLQDRQSGQILQAEKWDRYSTVGINHPTLQVGELKLYPNPAKGILFVLPGEITGDQCRLEVMDMTGRMVLLIPLPPGTEVVELPVSGLSRGLYILNCFNQDILKSRGKFIRID